MSYNVGSEYRRHAVGGASPVGLVVLLYGTIVVSLIRALEAVKRNDIEKRVSEINHVLKVIGQLQGVLDFERGGKVAVELDRFYNVMRARALQASFKNSPEILQELIKHFTSLKEAWQIVDQSTMGGSVLPAASGDRGQSSQVM
jgi:flagellar protein FliS